MLNYYCVFYILGWGGVRRAEFDGGSGLIIIYCVLNIIN